MRSRVRIRTHGSVGRRRLRPPLTRYEHIRVIDEFGRIVWQKKTGYGLRNYVELAMQRYKRTFGNTMKARKLPQQKAEAWACCLALNPMTNLGMPMSVKI